MMAGMESKAVDRLFLLKLDLQQARVKNNKELKRYNHITFTTVLSTYSRCKSEKTLNIIKMTKRSLRERAVLSHKSRTVRQHRG